MMACCSARSQPAWHRPRGWPRPGATAWTRWRALSAFCEQHLDDHVHADVVVVGVPAIVVGDHGDGGVAKLRLAREFGLRHVGHADDAAAPGPVQLAFRLGGELRPFHHQIGAAARHRQAERRGRRLQRVAEARADRVAHGDMGDAALAEEAFLACEAAVDELVDDDEMTGRQILAQAADRRQRDHFGAAEPLQRVDIGAVVQMAGRERMAAAVTRQEHAAHAGEAAFQQRVGRVAPGRRHAAPHFLLQPVHVIQAGAADDADDGLDAGVAHARPLTCGMGRKRQPPRPRRGDAAAAGAPHCARGARRRVSGGRRPRACASPHTTGR